MSMSEETPISNLKVEAKDLLQLQEEFSKTLELILVKTPTFKLDDDDSWSNLTLYQEKWEKMNIELKQLELTLKNLEYNE